MFNLEDLITELEKSDIRYLLIGGQAVTIYGSPLVSFDFDFWIDPAQRDEFLKIADSMDFEYGEAAKNKPMVIFYAGEEKIDVFFVKRMATKDGRSIAFEESYKRAVSLRDPTGFTVHLPTIDDLISLKECKKKLSAKDLEDIEYLKIIKQK